MDQRSHVVRAGKPKSVIVTSSSLIILLRLADVTLSPSINNAEEEEKGATKFSRS